MTKKEIEKRFEFDLNFSFEAYQDLICFSAGKDPFSYLMFVHFLILAGYKKDTDYNEVGGLVFNGYLIVISPNEKIFRSYSTEALVPRYLKRNEIPDYIKEYVDSE